jgi:hypothetical protein
MKHTGIVLRTFFPEKQKILLFDRTLGKLEAIILESRAIARITNGAALIYNFHDSLKSHRIVDLEIVESPFAVARLDLLFFHRLLELIHFFVPFGSPSVELFTFITHIYQSHLYEKIIQNQTLYLVRFFIMLGEYPEDDVLHTVDLYRLISLPIEVMLNENVDERSRLILDQFLAKCITHHPQNKQFKTISFFSSGVL